MLTNLLFFLFAGATLSALVWSAAELLRDPEDPLGDRLEQLRSQSVASAPRNGRRLRGGSAMDRFLNLVSQVPGGEDWVRGSEKLLQQAGVRRKSALGVYILLSLVFLAVLTAAMLWLQREKPAADLLAPMVAVFVLGFLLPKMVLQRMVKRRRRKLAEALPDTVDLLGIVLGTGLALDQAMMRVSEEMQYIYPALASEFATVVMQVRAGQERTVAFQQFVRRTGVEDIKSLAAMIVQSEKFGTSLAQSLKVYADALRMRRRLRAEAAVGKAGIKMLFPIVLFILPVLFIVTLVPALLNTLKDLKELTGAR